MKGAFDGGRLARKCIRLHCVVCEKMLNPRQWDFWLDTSFGSKCLWKWRQGCGSMGRACRNSHTKKLISHLIKKDFTIFVYIHEVVVELAVVLPIKKNIISHLCFIDYSYEVLLGSFIASFWAINMWHFFFIETFLCTTPEQSFLMSFCVLLLYPFHSHSILCLALLLK